MYRYFLEHDPQGIRIKNVFSSGGASFGVPSQFAYNIPLSPEVVTFVSLDFSESCGTDDTSVNLVLAINTPPTGVIYDDTDAIITPAALSLETFGHTVYTLQFELNDGDTFNTCFFYDTDKKIQCQIYDIFYKRCDDIACEDIECVLMYEALTRIQECDACADACDLLQCVLNCADEDKCNC